MTKNILIIGGTGMLAQATREIAKQGYAITLIARSPEELAHDIGAQAIAMNWCNDASVQQAVSQLQDQAPFDILISWIHDKGIKCLSEFEKLLRPGARSIRVHGSSAGDPRNGISANPAALPSIIRQNVVLGWVNEPGGRRWLTNPEISAGILQAFERPDQENSLIGTVEKEERNEIPRPFVGSDIL